MAQIIRLRGSPHDEVQRLLPWMANGTLEPDEVELVEAHLAECAECRADLAADKRLAQDYASAPMDVESGWARIAPRLAEDRAVVVEPAPGFWRRRVPVAWAAATPLAVAAAMALVFLNVTPATDVGSEYRALGSATGAGSANIVVLFDSNVPEKEFRAALDAVDARMIDGPTETGAYLVRVDAARRELALKSLRDNKAITLAEPIDGPANS